MPEKEVFEKEFEKQNPEEIHVGNFLVNFLEVENRLLGRIISIVEVIWDGESFDMEIDDPSKNEVEESLEDPTRGFSKKMTYDHVLTFDEREKIIKRIAAACFPKDINFVL